MKKKLTTLVLLLAFAAVAVTGGTLAYFTDTENATNTFTMGNVAIELYEAKVNPDTWIAVGENVTTTSNVYNNLYPGAVVIKNPTIKNVGNNPCYVRIQATNLDAVVYMTGTTENALGEHWKLENGYFYYEEPLTKDMVTTALFDKIKIPTTLTNGATINDITITAHAIQSEGFAAADDKTALQKAWEAFDAQPTT